MTTFNGSPIAIGGYAYLFRHPGMFTPGTASCAGMSAGVRCFIPTFAFPWKSLTVEWILTDLSYINEDMVRHGP